eukprot:1105633-Pelagomonas_calceolata.AAC.1
MVLNRAVPFLRCFSPFTFMPSLRFLRGLKELALAYLLSMYPTFNTLMTYCLISNSPNNLQAMLNRLKAYARWKFLTVNTKKSVIVCFNSKTDNLPPFFYDGEVLPYSNTFRYLGMQYGKHMICTMLLRKLSNLAWQAWLACVL